MSFSQRPPLAGNAPRPVEEKTAMTNRGTRFAGPSVRQCRVVGIGPAGVEGPVVPAPFSSGRIGWSPHSGCGGQTGWWTDLICFYLRTFRFARRCQGGC